jgi:hypothetical protein
VICRFRLALYLIFSADVQELPYMDFKPLIILVNDSVITA